MIKNTSIYNGLKTFSNSLSILLAVTALVACQGKGGLFNFKAFNERASETPAPSDQRFEKSFFVDPTGKPKTFLCGWAPEVEVGAIGEWLFGHLDHSSPHCNLEFEIQENLLVGKIVNPTFPNDRKKWREYVEIPILNHYYYERAKDGHGRETNEWIENSGRSHWSARPMMTLDFSRINFLDSGIIWSTYLSDRLSHSTVSDFDIDRETGFVGFTLNVRLNGSIWGYSGSEAQAKLRVNFLKFEHDPTFKKTPYHPENSRKMNILHVMGRRHEFQEELYAAHWDLRKPVRLYINGADDKGVQELLALAIEKWNQTFQSEGVVAKDQKAFEVVFHNRAHAFDLRYPGINWVSDPRISSNAPLGVGQAHADVKNGKILWGSVSLFGGLLEEIIQSYHSDTNATANGMAGGAQAAFSAGRSWFGTAQQWKAPEKLALPESLKNLNSLQMQNFEKFASDSIASEVQRLSAELSKPSLAKGKVAISADKIQEQIDGLKQQLSGLKNPRLSSMIASDVQAELNKLSQQHSRTFTGKSVIENMGFQEKEVKDPYFKSLAKEDQDQIREIMMTKSGNQRIEKLKTFRTKSTANFPDGELTGATLLETAGRDKSKTPRSFREVYQGVVMELTLHELGHMFGLGHNFKENILPEEGTVPTKIFTELSELAKLENGQRNMSTVMGYNSGRVWVQIDAKKLMPGEHDKLVIRYLYNQEYAGFNKEKDQFSFYKVPEHGRIPEVTSDQGTQVPTKYFDQCNDFEASYRADPFCNRWDYGSSAKELVEGYFHDLNDNLETDLFNFIGGRRADPDTSEWRLWTRAFNTMSRVRIFYDEMRLRLETDKELAPIWSQVRRSERAIMEFSSACKASARENIASDDLKKLFFDFGVKSKQLRDLCEANQVALNEIEFLMTLPEADYTRIDQKERFIMGGYLVGDAEGTYNQVFGKWYQLTNLPLKVSALYTLTREYAFLWPRFPNPFYYYEGRTPLYRSVFPREYTRAISEMARANIRFEGLGESDRTNLGQLLLSASFLIPDQNYGWNYDNGMFPDEYLNKLRTQTQFQFSVAAVLITANSSQVDRNTKPNRYKRFIGSVYDLMVGKSRTAREVYILPQGRVFVRANDMFLVPITRLKFYDKGQAYVIAIKIDYDYEVGDKLLEESVKKKLSELHEQINSLCISGIDGTGLSDYFSASNDNFEGFLISPDIHIESGKEKTTELYRSIDEEFEKYENSVKGRMVGGFAGKTMKVVCDDSLRGVGQISATAALLDGWWLSITTSFLR